MYTGLLSFSHWRYIKIEVTVVSIIYSQVGKPRISICSIKYSLEIYDLGYSSEVFAEIDSRIADENWRTGRSEDVRKTDHYGKKYSWIAYFEMAGYRQDQGLLKVWHDEVRLSDIDIDPSFPDSVQEINLISSNFLGDRNIPVEDWIKSDDKLEIKEWLVVSEIEGELGPWMLLDGYINQQDISAKRERFILPRGLLVNKRDASS